MGAAQDGDGMAYQRLLTVTRRWLESFYRRRLPPPLVDDAVQETLIAIHEKRHTYDRARPFKPWLAAIARYKWIDRLRAMARSRTEELNDVHSIPDHEDATIGAIVLDRLLAQLKPAQSTVIRLVKVDGFSIEDASRRTGQSGALVKVNIHRGLARLAALVESQAHADE